MDYESRIENIVGRIRNGESRELKVYGDLAPVYHFLYGKEYDYTGQADIAEKYAPGEVSRVVDGGCGTGGLTEILGERFADADVIGVDLNDSMLEVAREKTDHENVEFRNMDILDLEEEMGVFTFFGTTPHLEKKDLETLLEKIHESLSEEGILVLDFKSPEVKKHQDGHCSIWSRETEKFKVKNPITTVYEDERPHYVFSFEFTEKESDEKFYAGDIMEIYLYTRDEIREMLQDSGFSSIEFMDEGDQSGIFVGKKEK